MIVLKTILVALCLFVTTQLDVQAAEPMTFEIIGSSDQTIAMSAFDGGRVTFAITALRTDTTLTQIVSAGIEHPCFSALSEVNRSHVFDANGTTTILITYQPLGYPRATDTLLLTDGVDTLDIVIVGQNLSTVPNVLLLKKSLDFGALTMPFATHDSVGVVNLQQQTITLELDSANAPFAVYLTTLQVDPLDTVWIQVRCSAAGFDTGTYADDVRVIGTFGVLSLNLSVTLLDTTATPDTTQPPTIRLRLPPVSVLIGDLFSIAPSIEGPIGNATWVSLAYSYPTGTMLPLNAVADVVDPLYPDRRVASFNHRIVDGRAVTSMGIRATLGGTSTPTIIVRSVEWRDASGTLQSFNHEIDTCSVTIRDAFGIEVEHPSATALRAAPQPIVASDGVLNVDIRSEFDVVAVDVFSAEGTCVSSEATLVDRTKLVIDVSDFSPGMYHVRVRTTQDVATTMIAVLR